MRHTKYRTTTCECLEWALRKAAEFSEKENATLSNRRIPNALEHRINVKTKGEKLKNWNITFFSCVQIVFDASHLAHNTHMVVCSRIPAHMLVHCSYIDGAQKSVLRLCGLLLLFPSHVTHVLRACFITRLKPLAHCLVFPVSFSPSSAHGRMFDRGMVQDTLGVWGTFVLFCALVSKLIARWCFSTKRMRNQCCCIHSRVKRVYISVEKKTLMSKTHYEYGKRTL